MRWSRVAVMLLGLALLLGLAAMPVAASVGVALPGGSNAVIGGGGS